MCYRTERLVEVIGDGLLFGSGRGNKVIQSAHSSKTERHKQQLLLLSNSYLLQYFIFWCFFKTTCQLTQNLVLPSLKYYFNLASFWTRVGLIPEVLTCLKGLRNLLGTTLWNANGVEKNILANLELDVLVFNLIRRIDTVKCPIV